MSFGSACRIGRAHDVVARDRHGFQDGMNRHARLQGHLFGSAAGNAGKNLVPANIDMDHHPRSRAGHDPRHCARYDVLRLQPVGERA